MIRLFFASTNSATSLCLPKSSVSWSPHFFNGGLVGINTFSLLYVWMRTLALTVLTVPVSLQFYAYYLFDANAANKTLHDQSFPRSVSWGFHFTRMYTVTHLTLLLQLQCKSIPSLLETLLYPTCSSQYTSMLWIGSTHICTTNNNWLGSAVRRPLKRGPTRRKQTTNLIPINIADVFQKEMLAS